MSKASVRATRSAPVHDAPAEPSATRESVSIWFRLLSCHALILQELRRELDEHTTIPRFDLLASLHRHDGQTLAGLSRALLVTAGNITGLVDRAERDGVVVRKPDPADRRVARVWLTDRGRTLIQTLLPAHAKQVHAVLRGLPAKERKELRRLLGGLRDHLSPPAPPASTRTNGHSARTRA